jgi:hypothetical protein
MKEKAAIPDCYECKWRKSLVGSTHSSCSHPKSKPSRDDLLGMLTGMVSKPKIGINVKGNAHGIKMGWFNHPLEFDPRWLEECDGFEAKEK